MKTLMRTIAASMIIAGTAAFSTSAVAQVESQGQEQKVEQQAEKVEIRITEVPSPVSETISADYSDRKAAKAYKMTDPKTKLVVYEIHFTNAQGTTEKKKFSAEGEEIDG